MEKYMLGIGWKYCSFSKLEYKVQGHNQRYNISPKKASR